MEVTRPLLLGPFYLVKWPVNPNILAASVSSFLKKPLLSSRKEETPKPNYTTTFHPTDQPYQPNPFPFHFYVCTHRSSRADVGFSSLKKGPSNDRISTPSYSPSAQARLWPRQAARQLLYAHGFHVLIGLSHHYYTFLLLWGHSTTTWTKSYPILTP